MAVRVILMLRGRCERMALMAVSGWRADTEPLHPAILNCLVASKRITLQRLVPQAEYPLRELLMQVWDSCR